MGREDQVLGMGGGKGGASEAREKTREKDVGLDLK